MSPSSRQLEIKATPVGRQVFGIWFDRRRDGTPGWYSFGHDFDWVGTRAEAEVFIESFSWHAGIRVDLGCRPIEVTRVVETRDGCGHLVERRIFRKAP